MQKIKLPSSAIQQHAQSNLPSRLICARLSCMSCSYRSKCSNVFFILVFVVLHFTCFAFISNSVCSLKSFTPAAARITAIDMQRLTIAGLRCTILSIAIGNYYTSFSNGFAKREKKERISPKVNHLSNFLLFKHFILYAAVLHWYTHPFHIIIYYFKKRKRNEKKENKVVTRFSHFVVKMFSAINSFQENSKINKCVGSVDAFVCNFLLT